jgi:2-aminoethylphosphonate-pyruvate transaminase
MYQQMKLRQPEATMNHIAPLTFSGPPGQEDMPYLLTPGPLTTSRGVKLAMMADWGSRDIEFRTMVKSIREQLKALAGCGPRHECVLMQGSGTFAIEAALGSLAPATHTKTLVIANGAYGDRAAAILDRLKRPYLKIDKGDSAAPSATEIEPLLVADPRISHVWVIHCETTSGIVNPITAIGRVVKAHNRIFMVDAMSSFGALPLNMVDDSIDVMVSSSNKCIEGVPGFSYVILRRDLLISSEGKSHSVVLDLLAQWKGLEDNGQFRFTPPTHALAAFNQALTELADEGGVVARGERYHRNAEVLLDGLRRLGFTPLLTPDLAGPIIQTILSPGDPNFVFDVFYEALRARGFAIYPGKLTKRPSFRIGTIGKLDAPIMERVVNVIADVLKDMNVSDLRPVPG